MAYLPSKPLAQNQVARGHFPLPIMRRKPLNEMTYEEKVAYLRFLRERRRQQQDPPESVCRHVGSLCSCIWQAQQMQVVRLDCPQEWVCIMLRWNHSSCQADVFKKILRSWAAF